MFPFCMMSFESIYLVNLYTLSTLSNSIYIKINPDSKLKNQKQFTKLCKIISYSSRTVVILKMVALTFDRDTVWCSLIGFNWLAWSLNSFNLSNNFLFLYSQHINLATNVSMYWFHSDTERTSSSYSKIKVITQ